MAMERFITQRNIERYRQLAAKATTEDQRKKLLSLLAQEQANMKRELRDLLYRHPKWAAQACWQITTLSPRHALCGTLDDR
jgi:ureidoglycolate hydrolase